MSAGRRGLGKRPAVVVHKVNTLTRRPLGFLFFFLYHRSFRVCICTACTHESRKKAAFAAAQGQSIVEASLSPAASAPGCANEKPGVPQVILLRRRGDNSHIDRVLVCNERLDGKSKVKNECDIEAR